MQIIVCYTQQESTAPDSTYPQRNEFPCNHHFPHASGNKSCPSLLGRHQNLSDLLY